MLARIFFGLIGVAIGVLILRYSVALLNFFGRDPDAERIFSGGLGGTHFFIKLFSLGVIIFSLAYLFGYFS